MYIIIIVSGAGSSSTSMDGRAEGGGRAPRLSSGADDSGGVGALHQFSVSALLNKSQFFVGFDRPVEVKLPQRFLLGR